jgi:hypothetical protein
VCWPMSLGTACWGKCRINILYPSFILCPSRWAISFLYPSRIPPISLLYPSCIPLISLLYPSCIPPVSLLYPSCIPPISLLYPSHIPPISLLYPSRWFMCWPISPLLVDGLLGEKYSISSPMVPIPSRRLVGDRCRINTLYPSKRFIYIVQLEKGEEQEKRK